MASLRPAFTQLRSRYRTSASQCEQLRLMLQGLHIKPQARHTRPLSTLPPGPHDVVSRDELITAVLEGDHVVEKMATASKEGSSPNAAEKSLSTRGSGGKGSWQVYENRPLVDRPQWGDRPQQAELSDRGNKGSSEDNIGSDARRAGGKGPNKGVSLDMHVRAMPVSPSYFSRQPEFNDSFLLLQKLMRKYAHLPTVSSDQLERVAFRTLKDYRLAVGEQVKASEYARCMTLVKRLNKIHPKLAPPNIKDAISPFTRDINPHIHKAKDIPVDKFGRTLGVGKRKTSIARAWVVEGVGEVLVNGKSLADAFGRIHDRESAVWALKATARTDKYNVWALVEGGGTTGQAEALAMAVGKALMAHEPALKPALRRAGVVTRDPRGVERKKPGHLKARKKPAWVKR